MTYTENHIIETYTKLLEGLNANSKLELIERLSKSVEEDKKKEKAFYNSFGGFSSEKSAEEIIKEIKETRKFRNKDIEL
ncbi:hypothetical protein [Segetibacter aerophilus]|uniref:Uncharacterized protein n=1 Tax=Segetibacter aerophilus TaxID=670293 RepID=A0A512BBN2_9BACT|nr:hypothetical protein [Segetibacter aerophilus]GEO09379.1 hypothetical protein SAE01_18750 [Segetibacter aerophilus]